MADTPSSVPPTAVNPASGPGDTRPIPDPTVLTTQLIDRALSSLQRLLEARLDGMDRALILLQASADRLPDRVDEKIDALRGIHEEKFNSIQVQFKERDTRAEQMSKDSKVAVDAALQAAKEAVGEQNKSSSLAIAKSEAATMKQIDQMGLLIQTGNNAVNDKFEDIKDRLTRIEGKSQGANNLWGYIVGGVGLLFILFEVAQRLK